VASYQEYKLRQDWDSDKISTHPANFFRPSLNEACFKYFRPCQFQDACKTVSSEGMLDMTMDQNIWLPHLHKRMPLDEFLESLTTTSEE
jgi:hypothetical protein